VFSKLKMGGEHTFSCSLLTLFQNHSMLSLDYNDNLHNGIDRLPIKCAQTAIHSHHTWYYRIYIIHIVCQCKWP